MKLRRPFKLAILIISLVVVLTVVVLVACGKNPPTVNVGQAIENGNFAQGISIAGVDVSGLSAAEAKPKLETALAGNLDKIEIELQYDGQSFVLGKTELGAYYDFDSAMAAAIMSKDEGTNFDVELLYSQNTVDKCISALAAEVERPATEPSAQFSFENGISITYSEGQNGVAIEAEQLKAELAAALNGAFPKVITLPVTLTEPTTTIDEVASSTQLISSFSTKFKTSDKNRCENLRIGTEKLNGYTIAPGEPFSFNDVVGPRDEANGWKEATVIVSGSYDSGLGGGVCQVSTTLYVAVVQADLQIDVRHNHSLPSSYVPKGLDATVAYGTKDLVFINNTDSPVYIAANVDMEEGLLTVALYGKALTGGQTIQMRSTIKNETEPPEPEAMFNETKEYGYKEFQREPKTGYVVEVFKDYLDANGQVINSVKLYTDTYAPVQGIVVYGTIGAPAGFVESGGTVTSGEPASEDSDLDTPIEEEELLDDIVPDEEF